MTTKTLVDSYEKAQELLRRLGRLSSSDAVGFDTESYGPEKNGFLHVARSQMVGFSIALPDLSTYYVPMWHRGSNCPPLQARHILDALYAGEFKVWAWNWKHDYKVLLLETGRRFPSDRMRCAQVLAYMCDRPAPGKRPYNAKHQAKHFLDMDMTDFSDTFEGAITEAPMDTALEYAAADALVPLLMGRQLAPIARRYGFVSSYLEVEMPTVAILARMELEGMGISREAFVALSDELGPRLEQIREEWEALLPGVLITSYQQVGKALYDEGHWRTDGVPQNKQGFYSTAAEYVEAQVLWCKPGSVGRRAAELKLEFNFLHKNYGTYTTAIVESADYEVDGRLRGNFNQCVTDTGRLSSSDPNLQNIPIRTEMGRRIRDCFIESDGWTMVSGDYSQIELRVMAWLAGKGRLLEALVSGADPHQDMADDVGCDRSKGKTLNFAFLYGAHDKKLSRQMGVSIEQAREFRLAAVEARPEVDEARQRIVKQAYRDGFVRVPDGKIRRLPALEEARKRDPRHETFDERLERWKAERQAFNTPIQGYAQVLCKRGMIAAQKLIDDCFPNTAALVCQVHDDVIVRVKDEAVATFMPMYQRALEEASALETPLGRLRLDAKPVAAKSWGKMKD